MTGEQDDPLFFEDADAFHRWLDRHGGESDGIWVKIAKKHTAIASIDGPGAVDVVLCHGWIDGQRKGLDDTYFLQRYTPRRRRSLWSKVNRAKAERLIAEGLMRPAGLAEVERAKADGRWEAAYDGIAAATVPDDLASALDAAGLRPAFDALDGANRYAILHRVQTARRPETRARRIATFVDMLARGETPHPRPPSAPRKG